MRSIVEEFAGHIALPSLTTAERLARAQGRRVTDGLAPASSVVGILPYLDFGDTFEALRTHKDCLPDSANESLAGVSTWVKQIIAIRNRVAHTRPMEIDDSATLVDVAGLALSCAKSHWTALEEVVSQLKENPSYVLGLTINLISDDPPGPQHNLPVPDFDETGFFGRQAELRRIKKAVLGAYPVVSILGDGGIGKTSIALKIAYELLDDPKSPFDAVVWVSAKTTILTTNEIRRISGAIETSLGLFASVASELGPGGSDDPVAEVLEYMENFKVLLILDNLETVLDLRLRDFLLDLPMGSKVILTSRISPGIENPVQLAPLDIDDSVKLLRALCRIRDVKELANVGQPAMVKIAEKMAGHPAYIRWFVAGVQAGKRPEELIGKNELLLDYCMSNVYKYLGTRAKSAVQAMQVLPGARNQAELAFLNSFAATEIQAVLLELLTTNFVQMSSSTSAQSLDTVYQLSDFAKQYLDKHHTVSQKERLRFLSRSQQLIDLGSGLSAASKSSPYLRSTIHIRGAGDYGVARLLREAMQRSALNPSLALTHCSEAQVLAPTYYEAWRVEGFVRASMLDYGGATAAYERAMELGQESPLLLFDYGSYLVEQGGDPTKGRTLLQIAAKADPRSPDVAGAIAWAHYVLNDFADSVTLCQLVIRSRESRAEQTAAAVLVGLRAATRGLRRAIRSQSINSGAELLEMAVELVGAAPKEVLDGEAYDSTVYLASLAYTFSELSEGYLSQKSVEYSRILTDSLRVADPGQIDREVGHIKTVNLDKGFAFIASKKSKDYFVHYRDVSDAVSWDGIYQGQPCVFLASDLDVRGPRAVQCRLLT